MKNINIQHPAAPVAKNLFATLVVLVTVLLATAQSLCADTFDACLLKALKSADDSLTAGQIREQCRHLAGASNTAQSASPGTNVAASANSGSSVEASGPEEVILKTAQARKPAYFPHRKHQERYPCGTCHHGRDAAGNLVKYSPETIIYECTACHNADMPNEELNDLQSIGHALCRECHRTHQDITSAKCTTCHRKDLQ